jgi:CubicO group peptidase (beta-lactamase class C family)
MRKILIAVLALLLLPLSARADGWQTSSPEAQGMSSRELADLVTFGVTNGMDSLLVVRHGSIVAEAYYAPFVPGLRHRMNSSTKSVIGSLVAIAHDEGLIKSLDQPVLDFFPDRQFANTDARKKALTVQHLLDMTSGLKWDEPLTATILPSMMEMERSPDWVQYILDQPMAREPGASFEYNSGNPHVLSAILSKVTGRSAAEYAREKLFKPLGIDDVLWRHDPQGVSTGGYGLYLQPRDMAKLGQLWLHDGTWDGKRLLPAGWIDRVRHSTIAMGMPGLTYANLFWSIPGRDVFMAVGFHRQLIVVMPALDVVAVFTGAMRYSDLNGKPSFPSYGFPKVLDRLKAAVKSDTALPEDPAAVALLAEETKRVTIEARTEHGGSSPLAAAISGKIYHLKPNPVGISTFSLTFGKDTAAYEYEANGQHVDGPIGLEGLYGIGGHRLYGPSAAKGRWLDDKTFQVEVETVGNDDAAQIELTVDGKSLKGQGATPGGYKMELSGATED